MNPNQDVLDKNSEDMPSSSPILRWFIVILIIGLLLGGGYWYYSKYIAKPVIAPTPSSEVTEAIWKTKSEKTVKDFINYWVNSASLSDQAGKARDLLSIGAQAKLETFKDKDGKNYSDLKDKLTAFVLVGSIPKNFQLMTTKKIDEKTVEVTYKMDAYVRIFVVNFEGNSWLIDQVKEQSVTPSPIPSIISSPSNTNLSSPIPTVIPSQNL